MLDIVLIHTVLLSKTVGLMPLREHGREQVPTEKPYTGSYLMCTVHRKQHANIHWLHYMLYVVRLLFKHIGISSVILYQSLVFLSGWVRDTAWPSLTSRTERGMDRHRDVRVIALGPPAARQLSWNPDTPARPAGQPAGSAGVGTARTSLVDAVACCMFLTLILWIKMFSLL